MAANLQSGGRFVNYDPQTYSSYPGSLQGIPDLNIIPGLPSVSGYASIVNGNYESVTNTHEQNDLDIGQLSSGTLDRLDLREVVTVPEYFLVPLQAMPSSFDDFTQTSENIGSDPVLPRGYGSNYNDTAYPFYPGPRPALAQWADGVLVLRGVPRAGHRHPGPRPPGRARARASASGRCSRAASTRWGAAVAVPAGASVGDQSPSGRAGDRLVGAGAGRLSPVAASRDLRGRTSLRARGLAVVGVGARAVATGRFLPGLRGVHPPQAVGADYRLHGQRPAAGQCRSSRARRSPRTSGYRRRRPRP